MRLPIPTSLILPPLERCLGTSPRLKLQPAPLRQALAGEGRYGIRYRKILWHRDRRRLTGSNRTLYALLLPAVPPCSRPSRHAALVGLDRRSARRLCGAQVGTEHRYKVAVEQSTQFLSHSSLTSQRLPWRTPAARAVTRIPLACPVPEGESARTLWGTALAGALRRQAKVKARILSPALET